MSILGFSKARKTEEKPEERFLLSIDGGGIRGIVPSAVLSALSDMLKDEGDGRPLYAHFDLISGTSTGGLIALALSSTGLNTKFNDESSTPIKETISIKKLFWTRAEERLKGYCLGTIDTHGLVGYYRENARRIFHKQGRFLPGAFNEKYDTDSIEGLLKSLYKERKLKDELIPTFVTSYDTVRAKPIVISSYNEWRELRLWEAGRATSAAPLAFRPIMLKDMNGLERVMIDGGVISNNPSLLAIGEARKLYPNARRFTVLSLGTGSHLFSTNPMGYSGLAGWAEPLARIYPTANRALIEDAMRSMPDVEYIRVNEPVGKEKISLDDVRNETLDMLERGGIAIAKKYESELKALAKTLSKRPLSDALSLSGNGGEHLLSYLA